MTMADGNFTMTMADGNFTIKKKGSASVKTP